MRLTELRGRSVAVWGADAEGRAATAAIAGHSPSRLIAVDDSATYPDIDWEAGLAPLAGGDHAFAALVAADVVVRSSAVPLTHPWLADLRSRGIAVTSGSDLWMADHAAHAIVVTRGDDKNITAALLDHVLTALGRSAVLSVDTPLLALPAISPAGSGYYVVELSAARYAGLTSAPRVVVLVAGTANGPTSERTPSGSADESAPSRSAAGSTAGGFAGGSTMSESAAGSATSGSAGGSTAGGSAGRRATSGSAAESAAGGFAGESASSGFASGNVAGEIDGLLLHGPDLIVADGTDLVLRDALRGRIDANGFPPVPAGAGDSRFRVEDGTFYCSDEPLFPRSAMRVDGEPHGRALCLTLAVLDGLGFDIPALAADLRIAASSFAP